MSNIYFLGRDDRDGLDRLQSANRGLLTFDAEVGGWDSPGHNDEYQFLACFKADEVALRVFDSRTLAKQEPSKQDGDGEPWPAITYQVRFGDDQ